MEKSIRLPLWNCVERVLSSNILLAYISGRANSAADFLSRMQVEQTKLTAHVPIREIEIEKIESTRYIAVKH